MVLPCESIFSRTSLDGRPRNLHTFSKVNLKYTKRTFPVGQARCSFHLPHSYNLQILLARGNGASTNVEPCVMVAANLLSKSAKIPISHPLRWCNRFLFVSGWSQHHLLGLTQRPQPTDVSAKCHLSVNLNPDPSMIAQNQCSQL